jgi:hypothetical protein
MLLLCNMTVLFSLQNSKEYITRARPLGTIRQVDFSKFKSTPCQKSSLPSVSFNHSWDKPGYPATTDTFHALARQTFTTAAVYFLAPGILLTTAGSTKDIAPHCCIPYHTLSLSHSPTWLQHNYRSLMFFLFSVMLTQARLTCIKPSIQCPPLNGSKAAFYKAVT